MGELLRVSQFALSANIQESTVRSWLLRRKISFVRLGGRCIRIPRSELDRLVHEGTVPARGNRTQHLTPD
jgi:excisionase family DNA binding protein